MLPTNASGTGNVPGDADTEDNIRKIRMQKRDFSSLPPVITNQKLKAVAVECSSPANDDFMQCVIYDEFGVSRKVPNVSFVNHEVKDPFITNYKAQNGVAVSRVDFSKVERCEIMGHNKNGLTLKCGLGFFEKGGGTE